MRSARSLTAFYGSERARHDTKSLRVLLCCRFSDKFPSSFPCPLSSVFLVACRWIEKQKNQHFHDLKIPFFTRMTKHGVYNCSRGRGGCARDSRHVTQWPTHFDFNLFDVVFFLLLFFCTFRPTRSQWGSTTQLFFIFRSNHTKLFLVLSE
jgi:hypothetical protein